MSNKEACMRYMKKITPAKKSVDSRILTAALDLFVERGFHNVSVHDVRKQANVSIGSIYNHFGGKEGIAKALYYHLLKEFEEMIEEIIAKDLSFRERCNAIIRQVFEYTETRRNIVAFMLHAKHREFLPDEPPVCSSIPFKAMHRMVQDGMDRGEIRKSEPWVAASTVFGGAIRMVHLRLDNIIKEPLSTYQEELIDCMWQGMLPDSLPTVKEQVG